MRNLRNIQHSVLGDQDGLSPSACAWDVTNDSLICAYGPSKDNALVQIKRWTCQATKESRDEITLLASWDSPPPHPDGEHDSILSLKYFTDSRLACVIFAGGDIIVVRENPLENENKIEIVGSVDSGISAAVWSPDEELLALATKEDTFLYMTRDFDAITSTDFHDDDLKASKHVSVGWGKSETQFKGRGAKALRDPTMPERVEAGLPSEFEDARTTISWRGDGAYVAVNSVQASSRRVVRVYSREGILDGVSEPVDYLESALSWRPSGNLLACVQRSGVAAKVIFFERNGLRHGEFDLRLQSQENPENSNLVDLHWNVDSTVLAVSFKDRVQLWIMGNYHYYLKQELRLPQADLRFDCSYVWHPEQPLLSGLISSKKNIHRLEYTLTTNKGSTLAPNDNGMVSVIDGCTIKLTSFRLANVPPPMAQHEVNVEEPAIDVAILDSHRSSIRLAVLTHGAIYLYAWNIRKGATTEPKLLFSQKLSSSTPLVGKAEGDVYPQQVAFINPTQLQVLSSDGDRSYVTVIDLVDDREIVLRTQTRHLGVQELLTPDKSHPLQRLVLDSSGEIWAIGSDKTDHLLNVSAPSVHTEIISLPEDAARSDRLSPMVFPVTLTKSGSLFAGKRCLASNCTSFLTTSSHIIFTTSQHLLKFVHIDCEKDLEIPPDTPESDERCRSLERGAKLVTVIPSLSATVLQMPRGNLETIYPRALVLAEIRHHLNARSYKKAFMYCRNHRVDMNILHDYDGPSFLAHVSMFLEQIQKPEHIDLFLAQLRNEDVSVTMYKETLKSADNEEVAGRMIAPQLAIKHSRSCSKINEVCDAFLVALQPYRRTHLQNIITAHCCKDPPDLESGLSEVTRMFAADSQAIERAVEHICFLVDVNRLYDTALGLYDIRLAHLVAQQSQKDPREYLPFLQKLREQPMVRMKFDIDNHLGRYKKCLRHLQDLDDFEQFKAFVVDHELYEEALIVYRRKEPQIKGIMQLFATYLSQASSHKQAGIAYEYLADYAAAAEAYRLAHMWQEALSCAGLVPLEKGQLLQFAQSMAESLAELKNYHAAATIYLDYSNDIESALRLYCKGYHFSEAMRILALRQRPDLLESIIDPGLTDGMSTITELIADCKGQLNAQVPRIRELRVKKAEAPLSFLDAENHGDANIPDNVSLAGTDASTVGESLFTRYTNRSGTVATHTTRQTSKNRRREERKKARGKKGSVYEEAYLVNSVGRLFERINSVNEEAGRLVEGLVRRGMREQAMAVESSMVSIVEMCDDCRLEVFQTLADIEAQANNSTNALPVAADKEGGNGLEDFENALPRAEAPAVKAFQKLSFTSS